MFTYTYVYVFHTMCSFTRFSNSTNNNNAHACKHADKFIIFFSTFRVDERSFVLLFLFDSCYISLLYGFFCSRRRSFVFCFLSLLICEQLCVQKTTLMTHSSLAYVRFVCNAQSLFAVFVAVVCKCQLHESMNGIEDTQTGSRSVFNNNDTAYMAHPKRVICIRPFSSDGERERTKNDRQKRKKSKHSHSYKKCTISMRVSTLIHSTLRRTKHHTIYIQEVGNEKKNY